MLSLADKLAEAGLVSVEQVEASKKKQKRVETLEGEIRAAMRMKTWSRMSIEERKDIEIKKARLRSLRAQAVIR